MSNYINIDKHVISERLIFEHVYTDQRLEESCYEPDEFEKALRHFLNVLHDEDLMKIILYNSEPELLNKVVTNGQFQASKIIQTELNNDDLELSTKQHRALINVFVFYRRRLFEDDFMLHYVF